MKLTLFQINFLNFILDPKNRFKNKALQISDALGSDGAFYFTIGEFQTLSNNFSFDELSEDSQEDFIELIITEFPELEF